MSIEREFFREVKVGGRRTRRKRVLRRCDSCEILEEADFYVVKRGRERHPGCDYCSSCAKKHRKRSVNGKNHGNFKHGLTSHGYRRVVVNGKRMYEHRLIAEKMLGRRLLKGESVHHIDLNKINNNECNLFICKDEIEHQEIHYQLEQIGYSLIGNRIWFDCLNKKYTDKKVFIASKKIKDEGFSRYVSGVERKKMEYIILPDRKGNKTITRLYHAYLIEREIGRRLYSDECVHHIDGNPLNNEISNLFLLKRKEHSGLHRSLQRLTLEILGDDIHFDRDNKRYTIRMASRKMGLSNCIDWI